MTPTTVQRLTQSQNMRLVNAKKLPERAQGMYLDGKVKLCRADQVSSQANNNKGWVTVQKNKHSDD